MITAEGVSFAYDGAPVLDGVTLEVRRGEIVALVGPNGSGKTTLLRHLSGLLKPHRGAVYLDFQNLHSLSPRELARRLGVVEQGPSAGFDFTVWKLVELGRIPHLGRLGRFRKEDEAAVRRALALTGISGLAHRPLSTLSGGERQRAFLAVALAQEPQALLLDEPTSHLDVDHQLQIMEIIRGLAASGLAVAMAIHDLNLAAAYATRVALLHRGRIVAWGPPEETLTPANLSKAFNARFHVRRGPEGLFILALPKPP